MECEGTMATRAVQAKKASTFLRQSIFKMNLGFKNKHSGRLLGAFLHNNYPSTCPSAPLKLNSSIFLSNHPSLYPYVSTQSVHLFILPSIHVPHFFMPPSLLFLSLSTPVFSTQQSSHLENI